MRGSAFEATNWDTKLLRSEVGLVANAEVVGVDEPPIAIWTEANFANTQGAFSLRLGLRTVGFGMF